MRSATRAKKGKDGAYLAWLHTLPCVACQNIDGRTGHMFQQLSKTEAAHIGSRGLSQKCPDREAIPLCGIEHHREGKFSVHHLGRRFWEHHGLDREKLIQQYQERYDAEN